MRVEKNRGSEKIRLALQSFQNVGIPELANAAAMINGAELAESVNLFLLASITNCWACNKNVGYLCATKVRANAEEN